MPGAGLSARRSAAGGRPPAMGMARTVESARRLSVSQGPGQTEAFHHSDAVGVVISPA